MEDNDLLHFFLKIFAGGREIDLPKQSCVFLGGFFWMPILSAELIRAF